MEGREGGVRDDESAGGLHLPPSAPLTPVLKILHAASFFLHCSSSCHLWMYPYHSSSSSLPLLPPSLYPSFDPTAKVSAPLSSPHLFSLFLSLLHHPPHFLKKSICCHIMVVKIEDSKVKLLEISVKKQKQSFFSDAITKNNSNALMPYLPLWTG